MRGVVIGLAICLPVWALVALVVWIANSDTPEPVVDEWRCVVLQENGEPVMENGMIKTAPAPDARCDYWRDQGVVK